MAKGIGEDTLKGRVVAQVRFINIQLREMDSREWVECKSTMTKTTYCIFSKELRNIIFLHKQR